MRMLSVHIWYDSHGKILAVGCAPAGKDGARRRVIPQLLDGQNHLQVDAPEETVVRLHETHHVDVAAKALMRKS